ncbi:FMN-binding protein [Thermospira aquatica]|uniref:FMN-binding protein n=1 Tax=Thermospira aquatica TaxID=2828656 RepID=A0AAX3BEM5_9SPIR|nr:FMN-binding protein [Thermospira aquatica]URA10792.1 FMN-binding protein [Thermospira aquatica]
MSFLKKLYPLVLIATVMGGLLAFTYGSLKPFLDASDVREFERSLRELYPDFSRYETKTLDGKTFYELYSNDEMVAKVFRTSAIGYGGLVEILTAITNGVVARVVVMSMPGETPGLGTKAKNPAWLAQFLGKKREEIPTSKADFKAKGYDAVSGATFSSLAVTRAIHEALSLYERKEGDSTTSATSQEAGGR